VQLYEKEKVNLIKWVSKIRRSLIWSPNN
jgi:hypothetical protein